MIDPKEMAIRFDERIRIFSDSKNCQASFGDLAQIYEDFLKILEMIGSKPAIGFAQ